jgi:hypothetical protein
MAFSYQKHVSILHTIRPLIVAAAGPHGARTAAMALFRIQFM